MTELIVNGRATRIAAEPRTHLADALREELLLTGTHIGCEHGVCGACTVLIDDCPARACLVFPALCEGASVRTIEGLQDDPTMQALNAAFKAEHALQCGFCTPGMLITARDIVLRLPDADDDRVRFELAGNLCRCTGYNGIVRAIRRVLADPPAPAVPAPSPIPSLAALDAQPLRARKTPPRPGGPAFGLSYRFSISADALWAALQEPALLVGCLPGATLTAHEGEALRGELVASLGPIRMRFSGEGRLRLDASSRAGTLEGDGRDRLSGTRASGRVAFRVTPAGSGAILGLETEYSLRGPLAQLARPAIVEAFAAELIASFAARLEAQLSGAAAPAKDTWWRVIWRALRRMIGRGDV